MDEDNMVPAYYVVNKSLGEPETEFILHALRITPITCVVITDAHDAEFAIKLSGEIKRATDFAQAQDLARYLFAEFGRSVLIIGDADFLDAYYMDGHKESVAHHA